MPVTNTASALGEAIGIIIENEIENILKPICNDGGYNYDHGGERPGIKGVKLSMVNKSGNRYQLDGVIKNAKGEPIVLLESKYLRYTKHNRDKGSWTCAAHYSLRKSHTTIRKSIAVLSGNWSLPSKKFIESFGVELHVITFEHMCTVLNQYGIKFDWQEKDRRTPNKSFKAFQKLTQKQKNEIGQKLLAPIKKQIEDSILKSRKIITMFDAPDSKI
ncbi:hypothetical protein HY768_10685 [candidate division TA06 bacterium]|uniref:Restriction endonuclease n=1 Tax=candidate division TA06 bacterium TaxID=2250710 RepID=A0A933ICW2_UNCT6|nr:hypothetical protein [candidate division TA06 bacterium]